MPRIKIFCDIADAKTIKEFNKKSIVDGFTTNPSLMRKAGAKDYEKYSKEILKICKKPISFEVFSDNFKSMKREALIINSWSKTVYVKIPVTNGSSFVITDAGKTLLETSDSIKIQGSANSSLKLILSVLETANA